jgi:7-cyano-7-deazaguanine synthase
MKPAVVLLSGGLDSATVTALAREQGFECHALSVRYGQRHSAELDAAAHVAAQVGATSHRIVDVDLRAIGGSALTDDSIDVPTTGVQSGIIPVTYVPARNTIMLALALGHAEVLGANDIFYGANAVDYSGYPDCRPSSSRPSKPWRTSRPAPPWKARSSPCTRRSSGCRRQRSFAKERASVSTSR